MVLPVNTCMLYIADNAFKDYYTESAIAFMENCLEKEENLCHMVFFAEQRMLAMCAEKKQKKISSFFSGFDGNRKSGHFYAFMGI